MYEIIIDREEILDQEGSSFYFKKEELQNALDFFFEQRNVIEIRKVDDAKESN